ncbi:DUF3298 and DUF4163 domain-containing protein [Snuella sedimenti]|uniref:DUF3298 and DUF4163 domain-containing protein n=1 Tax=Snuella sedimenti TaxID=2798802 RepID=A0A8J7LN22_9FLAO|nr:DUF3298 and DUF4163 domain-containing protein [Snuella sedimenti]MBJ6368259.1 DUF3298 and DUF4163 domain-containing protein [Snuella sedimenti]
MLRKTHLLLHFLIVLYSCNNTPKIAFSETRFTTNNNTLVTINIPLTDDDHPISKHINSIIKKEVTSALQIDSPNNSAGSIEDNIIAFNNAFNTFKNEFPESAQQWEAQIDGDLMFQSQEIISIAITSYINTGGAHGNTKISFLNFNAKTGETLNNIDLFKDLGSFKKVAKAHFKSTVLNKDITIDSKNFTLPNQIGFSEEGLILLYNTYEIAPYSTGIIEFTIPYHEIDTLLIFNGS